MTEILPLPEAGTRLGELVRRARAGEGHVILTEGDVPVAAIVDIATLREMQQAQDDADIALCLKIKADAGPQLTHDESMAILEAEDAAAS